MAKRARAGDAVEPLAVLPGGGIGWGTGEAVKDGDRREDLCRDGLGTASPELGRPRWAKHDPDIDASPRHRRDPHVPVADDAHARVRRWVTLAIGEVEGEPDARCEKRRSADPGGTRNHGQATVRADDKSGSDFLSSGWPAHGQPHGIGAQLDPLHSCTATDPCAGCRGTREQGRVKRRSIEANRPVGAVSQAKGGPVRRLDAHRRDPPRHRAEWGGIHPDPRERRHRGGRAEDPARAPSIRGRALEHEDVVTAPGEEGRDDRAGRSAADDGHVGVHHDPTGASTAAGGGTATIA
jgi:hypothetical protein